MFVVISYDIKNDKRRTRVFKTLKNYGQRTQYSVFECSLKKTDFLKLRRKLEKTIKPDEDSIRFYFLCEKDIRRVERIGGIKPWPKDAIIV
jgi:CRISPR-associated protein Cas2